MPRTMPRAPGVTQVFAIACAVLHALVCFREPREHQAPLSRSPSLCLRRSSAAWQASPGPRICLRVATHVAVSCRCGYLVPALGLPLGSGGALRACAGWVGAALWSSWFISALLGRIAHRLTRPGALRIALLPVRPSAASSSHWKALPSADTSGGSAKPIAVRRREPKAARVTLVERAGSLDLFIDGELQFRTADERLYHEGLVAPALASSVRPWSVLVMGGGDGLVARDLLRCARVDHVTIVDWDPLVTRLFRREAALTALNEGALVDPRVEILHRDVRDLLAESGKPFDVVIGDLTDPDPLAEGSGLLTPGFFAAVRGRLAPGGIVVTHASSPAGVGAPKAVHDALVATGFLVRAYARTVPSFGSVGYLIGSLAGGPAIELPSWAKPLSFDA